MGYRVIVWNSNHGDVAMGAQGIVDGYFEEGIAVKITGQFSSAADPHARTLQTRVLYFLPSDIHLPSPLSNIPVPGCDCPDCRAAVG